MTAEGNLLIDPGEGALRQLILMGLAGCRIEHIFVSNHRLDHCLGLPSVLQHLLDSLGCKVSLLFPAESAHELGRLLDFSGLSQSTSVRMQPLTDSAIVDLRSEFRVARLAHDIASLGLRWRLTGGEIFSFVPDTAPCQAAIDLARDADLLLCHADDLDHRRDSVHQRALMTARDAAVLARDAGVNRMLLSHYQPMLAEPTAFLHEARRVFVASDITYDLTEHAIESRAELTTLTNAS